ncbi:MAG: hypothetical protein N4A54_01240 [Peptostreptococcaceae bacterium]|jgi:hypothetical protein|nr:hypothetical protein [Peptostreptococcaceae bacterium]
MKSQEIINIIDSLVKLLKSKNITNENKRDKLINQMENIKNDFKDIKIDKKYKDVYNSLLKRGKNIKKEIQESKDQKDILEKALSYKRFLTAARGDFRGEHLNIQKYYWPYILTSVLFLALSPQYFGFVLPMIFFVPIFLGVRGVRSRAITGLYMSLTVVPVSYMTSFIWMKYGIYAFNNYNLALTQIIEQTGRSNTVSNLLLVIPPILGVILFLSASVQLYLGYKSKDLFI